MFLRKTPSNVPKQLLSVVPGITFRYVSKGRKYRATSSADPGQLQVAPKGLFGAAQSATLGQPYVALRTNTCTMLVLEQAWLAPSAVPNPFAQSYKMGWGAEPQPTMSAEASLMNRGGWSMEPTSSELAHTKGHVSGPLPLSLAWGCADGLSRGVCWSGGS